MQLNLDHTQQTKLHLIGVSGGRDSVALLHELHRLGWRKLVVCHVNHRLRGRASAGDATFVRALAKRLGYRFESCAVDVAALAVDSKQSVETTARRVRHEFFATMAKKHRCKRVFLAHHAEDQAETVLMRILRGTGIGGLAGMEGETDLCISKTSLTLVRPMLTVRRREIDDYLQAHALKFREDETNAIEAATRNRVRLSLLPSLSATLGRDVTPMLVRLAAVASREDAFMEEATTTLIVNADLFSLDGRLRLEPALRSAPSALQHRVLHRWLKLRNVSDLHQELIEQAVGLLTKRVPAKINLAAGRWLRRKAGVLWVEESH